VSEPTGPTDPAFGRVARVPALGGERTVPVPDAIARDYLLLALRLDQRDPGLVDGYLGPADLKAQVDVEQPPSPARLRAAVAELRARVALDVVEPDRRAWLDAQLVALETRAAVLDDEEIPYLEQVARSYAWTPERRPESTFDAAATELEQLLPGEAPLDERLAAWDERLVVDLRGCPRSWTGWWPSCAARRAPLRHSRRRVAAGRPHVRPAVERLQLVRRRAPLAGRPQHGPADPRPGAHRHARP
jgi:hypothetical protein